MSTALATLVDKSAATSVRDAQFERELSMGFASLVQFFEQKSGQFGEMSLEEALGEEIGRTGNALPAETAMRVAAVWGCRRVIGEDIAKMPRAVKRRWKTATGEQRTEIMSGHPVHELLTQSPCEWLRPMEFFEWWVGGATVHRGSYAYIVRDDAGNPVELLPMLPGSVQASQNSDWDVQYTISGYGHSGRAQPGTLLRLHGPMDSSGTRGYQVSRMAREAIGLAAQMESSQARFHANDMRPSGALQIKNQKISQDVRDRIRQEWEIAYGPNGRGGIAVLDAEFDFKTFNLTGADSQVIENRRMQIEEICRFFRVFPQLIMHNAGNTYGSFEQALENHTKLTLVPWVTRVEEALSADLLTQKELRDGFFVDLDVDAVMRGTWSDRVNGYDKAVRIYLTPNEIRIREGLDPLPGEHMNRVQQQANNTGLLPSPSPAKPDATAKPTPASDARP